MKTTIQSVKGTRDFYPEEMAIHHWLRNIVVEVSESFGYQAYEGPYLEKLDLYAAKSGEELVKEVDAVILHSLDGRKHLPQVIPVLKAKKPVFIDKPLAGTLAEAIAIKMVAEKY